jgi:hypothetical protein
VHGVLLELADAQRCLANAMLCASDEPAQIMALGNARVALETALKRLGQALA